MMGARNNVAWTTHQYCRQFWYPYFQYFDALVIRQKQMLFVGTEPNKTCRKQFFFGVFLVRGPPK